MKVSELIEKLKELPQDANVEILYESVNPDEYYSRAKYCNMDEYNIYFNTFQNIVQLGG